MHPDRLGGPGRSSRGRRSRESSLRWCAVTLDQVELVLGRDVNADAAEHRRIDGQVEAGMGLGDYGERLGLGRGEDDVAHVAFPVKLATSSWCRSVHVSQASCPSL